MRALVPNLPPDLDINKFTHRQTFADGFQTLNTSAQNIWNTALLKKSIRKTARVPLRSKLRVVGSWVRGWFSFLVYLPLFVFIIFSSLTVLKHFSS